MTAILKVDTIQDTSGNNIINESSDTITIGASGDTTNIIGTLQNNGSALNFATVNGITEADIFRLTADRTGDGDLTANLERVDDASFAKIGTGMTESSGIFSFPSTGLYHVMTHSNFEPNSSGDNCKMNIKATTNNSSYDDLAAAVVGNIAKENTTTISTYINVTDVSNVKVKFTLSSMTGTSHIKGDTNYSRSCFVFIRLGDSQ